MASHTAGVIIIGDEILKGQTIDINSPFICKRLHALGVKLCKISVVLDDVVEIAEEVRLFSRKYNVVITTGGIGPTHDDVTYEGVAKAFNEPLVVSKELCTTLSLFYPGSSTDANINPALRMARIPKSAKLLFPKCDCKKKKSLTYYDIFPTVCIANVYIFPGIPEYLQYSFCQFEHLFRNPSNGKFHVRSVFFNKFETELVPALNHTVECFKEFVTFGSYPVLGNDEYCTKIIMESAKKQHVVEAEAYLKKQVPADWIVAHNQLCLQDVIDSVYETAVLSTSTKLSKEVSKSVKILLQCFKKYSVNDLFLSFNGGKDCTVLLHLVSAVLWKERPDQQKSRLKAVYIRNEDPFPEVEDFIEDSLQRYNLDLQIVSGPIKSGLSCILKDKPHLKAVLMGTRKTDPFAESLQSFQMTDSGWPQVMRVNPLLDWDYQDIWSFLKLLSIPYCSLYDLGYTSIGSRKNTNPNPYLSYADDSGCARYKPAYMLEDGNAERSGRE